MTKDLSIAEQLCYITTRIITMDADKNTYVATGFFVSFSVEGEDEFLNVLVTNRHVVENAEEMVIWLNERDSDNNPIDSSMIQITITDAKSKFIYHPDKNIDLALYMILPTITDAEKALGRRIFYKSFTASSIITDEQSLELDAVEDVLMIGYPRGLWDEKNNRPIIRYGITATDPKVDYCGNREFMIDCACIHGSSGSPVLLYYKGVFCNKYGKETCYDSLKVILLGIQYAIPLRETEGRIVKTNTPTAEKEDIPVIGLPINLGYIVKAQCLYDFIPLLEKECNLKLKRP